MHTGPLGMIGGAIAGGMGMGQGSEQDQQRRAVLQTYQGLLDPGIPEPQARLAAISPEYGKEIAKALGPQTAENLGQGYIRNPRTGEVTRAYTPEQHDNFVVVQTGEDGLGRKTFAKMNKATGEQTPITAAADAGGTGGGLGNMDLTGKEYLASMPIETVRKIQLMQSLAMNSARAVGGAAAVAPAANKTRPNRRLGALGCMPTAIRRIGRRATAATSRTSTTARSRTNAGSRR
jgi:hypothetical protein